MLIAKNLVADVRYAFRMLRLHPGFTAVAVLSIALGIGANTAIFSLIDTLLLRSLPVADPDRLVLLSDPDSSGVAVGIQGGERSLFTYEEFEYLRDHNQVFSGMFASESDPARLELRIDNGPPEEVRGKLVSGDYFGVLGVRPAHGRALSAVEETGPGAGLFLRTLFNLKRVDLGYSMDRLLIVRVDPLGAGYTGASRGAVYRRLLESLRSIPGVRGVTMSENGLFSGTGSGDKVAVEGYHSEREEDNASRFDQVGPDYFSTLGIPMLLGREIGPQDNESEGRVCVINEAFAKFYFKGLNPFGRHVTDEFPDTRFTFEIVGVAKDARDHRLRGEVPRRFYVPLFHPLGDYPQSAYYELRTIGDPDRLITEVRRKIREVDEALPVSRLRSLGAFVDSSVTRERMIAQVSGFFGGLALFLAAIGLYGVLAYSIARRNHEIGIRMALGAGRRRILAGVMRETLILLGIGVAIGVPAAFACVRLVRSALIGLETVDLLTLGASVAALAATAAAAGYLPARRASRVDPLVALRCE